MLSIEQIKAKQMFYENTNVLGERKKKEKLNAFGQSTKIKKECLGSHNIQNRMFYERTNKIGIKTTENFQFQHNYAIHSKQPI